jgi:membrane protein required for colicin V production
MNLLDIIILICLILALIHGIIKGFISQAISLISIIVGVWAASHFSDLVYQWLAAHITGSEQTLKIAAFAIIFVIVIVALTLIGKLLEKVIELIMLGWLNRLLGGVFAVAKWLLIMGVITIGFNYLNETFNLVTSETLAQSQLYQMLNDIAGFIFPNPKNLFIA